MSTPLLAVRLDDPNYGAGPGTVIAIPRTISEYEALVRTGRRSRPSLATLERYRSNRRKG